MILFVKTFSYSYIVLNTNKDLILFWIKYKRKVNVLSKGEDTSWVSSFYIIIDIRQKMPDSFQRK